MMITNEEMTATTPQKAAQRTVAVMLGEDELAFVRASTCIPRDATAVAAYVRRAIAAEKGAK